MRLHLETPRVEIQGLEKKTMVTSLKHPGKKQSGSSSRLPLTWTKRATPPALAHSATSTGPWDRQMDRMTDIERLKTLRQTDAQTRCRNLQGPARPGDHCAVLALGTHAQPGSWDQPTSAWSHCKPRHPATPPSRHPAILLPQCSVRAQGRPHQARETPGARMPPRRTRRPAPSLRTPETPTPRVRFGPSRHPPSSSHPAASAGAGASIPRGSPGLRRPLCRPHRRACAEPPRGAGPGPALTVAHAGPRLAG